MNHISTFPSSSYQCAVAVGLNKYDLTHCGILYKITKDNITLSYFLHLGSPLSLSNDTLSELDLDLNHSLKNTKYFWKPFVNVPIVLLEVIRSRCMAIANVNSSLPYGIYHDESSEFRSDGSFFKGESSGLTCSSFVKTVLKSCKVDIIHGEDWPDERDSDVDWLKKMVTIYEDIIKDFQKKLRELLKHKEKLRRNKLDISDLQKTIKKFGENIGLLTACKKEFEDGQVDVLKRYRPEEVSACSYENFDSMPIKFTTNSGLSAFQLSENVLEFLNNNK